MFSEVCHISDGQISSDHNYFAQIPEEKKPEMVATLDSEKEQQNTVAEIDVAEQQHQQMTTTHNGEIRLLVSRQNPDKIVDYRSDPYPPIYVNFNQDSAFGHPSFSHLNLRADASTLNHLCKSIPVYQPVGSQSFENVAQGFLSQQFAHEQHIANKVLLHQHVASFMTTRGGPASFNIRQPYLPQNGYQLPQAQSTFNYNSAQISPPILIPMNKYMRGHSNQGPIAPNDFRRMLQLLTPLVSVFDGSLDLQYCKLPLNFILAHLQKCYRASMTRSRQRHHEEFERAQQRRQAEIQNQNSGQATSGVEFFEIK
jgi:hypothetical protein